MPSTSKSALLCLLIACTPMALIAGDVSETPATAEASASVHALAEARSEAGRKALQIYRKDQAGNPNAVVDAAVAFTEAHKLYQQLNDTDAVSEMQANIFWCKKQMNLDAVKSYLSQQGKTNALAEMNEVADKKVEVNEGVDYLDRAKRFANDHATDLNGISIRYFEVAERFVGTPIGLEAQKLSLDAQNRYMQWLQSGGMARQTRFTAPTAVKSGTRVAIPDDKSQKAVLADLKKLYAKDYSQRSDSQKSRFAAKLSAEAEKSRGDAATYFTTLNEVCRLAQEAEDYERLLDTIDLLAASFNGYEAAEQKKSWLKKMTGKPTASAIITLLTNPQEPAANTVVGKFFCLQLDRWSEGLPMLAICGDADLKAVAEQELANPTEDTQRIQVADAWYNASKKGSTTEKNAMLARAQHWYVQPKDLTGILKERVSQRLAEIDRILPLDLDHLDFDNLTPTQWTKLKGAETVIQVRSARSGPIITLKPDQRFRVVPNPADTWTCQAWYGAVTCNFVGADPRRVTTSNTSIILSSAFDSPYPDFRYGALLVQVDKNPAKPAGIVTGPGNVWIIPNAGNGDRKGQIRIKLVPIDD